MAAVPGYNSDMPNGLGYLTDLRSFPHIREVSQEPPFDRGSVEESCLLRPLPSCHTHDRIYQTVRYVGPIKLDSAIATVTLFYFSRRSCL